MCFVLACVFVIHSKMSTYSFTAVSTASGNCSDGELRLVGGSDNVQTETREGTDSPPCIVDTDLDCAHALN